MNNSNINYVQKELLSQSGFSDNLKNPCFLKKIEDLIKNFLGRLSYYKDLESELSNEKILDKLAVVRKEDGLIFPIDLDHIYNDIQNLVLIENELNNYKIDNKKLLLEFNNIMENFTNISCDMEIYKNKIAYLEKEIENVRYQLSKKINHENDNRENKNDEYSGEMQKCYEENNSLRNKIALCEEANKLFKKEMKESRFKMEKMQKYCEEIKINKSNNFKQV